MKTRTRKVTSKKKEVESNLHFFEDVFAACLDPAEAAVERLRGDLLNSLRTAVNPWTGTQKEKADRLGITQPRYAVLMNASTPGKYSLDNLVALNVRAGVPPPVFAEVKKPKAQAAKAPATAKKVKAVRTSKRP